ncbi:MAG: branched-chain amino acid ABC transporter permease [Candidatus Zixiibacteriota bacterium]
MTQIIVNSLIAASIYTLVGIGFSLIYNTGRFFHFAHAATFTLGAYFIYTFNLLLHIPLILSAIFSILGCGILGMIMDKTIFSTLRNRGASALIMLLASLGLYVVLQNSISVIYGDHIKSIRVGEITEGIPILGARITEIQSITVMTSILILMVIRLILKKTNIGISLRAVANNPILAQISGIDSNKVILFSFFAGSAFAGLAGILVSMDIDMTPSMGMAPFMMAVVAVIIGGISSISGIALGAIFLAFVQNLGILFVSSQWQDAIAFGMLIIFLIIRPQGFLGRRI